MPNMSEQINELASALAKVQSQLPAVQKSKTATVRGTTKAGKPYEYDYAYATLEGVWDCCRQLLTDNGLAVSQTMQEADGHPHLETILLHTSGQWLSSSLPLIATADPQQLGSCITYMRRYALASLVGIVADEDDDGQAGRPRQQGKQQEQKPIPQQSRQRPVGETQQTQQQTRQRPTSEPPINGTQNHQGPGDGTPKKPADPERAGLIAQIVQMEKTYFLSYQHKENARLKHLGYGELSEGLNEDLVRYRDYLDGKHPFEEPARVIAAN